jgi:hypothetical protein
MHEEEKDEEEVKICMHVLRLLQRHYDPICPGVAGDQEDDHEQEKHPGGDAIYLNEESANIQNKFTKNCLILHGY